MEDLKRKAKKLRKKLDKIENQIKQKDDIVTLTDAIFTSGNIHNNIEVEFLLFRKYKCTIDLYDTKIISPNALQDSLIEMIKIDIKDLEL